MAGEGMEQAWERQEPGETELEPVGPGEGFQPGGPSGGVASSGGEGHG